MFKLISLITTPVIILLLVLLITNPSAQSHRDAFQNAMQQNHAVAAVAAVAGLGSLTSQGLDYHSYYVCSYTVSGGKVATVGAFGKVWVEQK